MKKNILVPHEIEEKIIDENGEEIIVTRTKYRAESVDMTQEEIAEHNASIVTVSTEERKEKLLSQIAELYKQYSDIDNEVSV